MKIEELLKEPNKDLALTKAIAAITIMKHKLELIHEKIRDKHCHEAKCTCAFDNAYLALKEVEEL